MLAQSLYASDYKNFLVTALPAAPGNKSWGLVLIDKGYIEQEVIHCPNIDTEQTSSWYTYGALSWNSNGQAWYLAHKDTYGNFGVHKGSPAPGFTGVKMTSVKKPSALIFLCDTMRNENYSSKPRSGEWAFEPSSTVEGASIALLHGNHSIAAYVDGHATTVTADEAFDFGFKYVVNEDAQLTENL